MKKPTTIEIDAGRTQTIAPPSSKSRFEGVAFSPSGRILGVVDPDLNSAFLFRRKMGRQFDHEPYCVIDGSQSGLSYPHDLSFAKFGDSECLAVGQRTGAIAIFAKSRSNDQFGSTPVFEIRGSQTGLEFSDGVAFIPPTHQHMAACNLTTGTISFYARTSAVEFRLEPIFELRHPCMVQPDGLAFSSNGAWMAVANHGNNTVSIFARRADSESTVASLEYGPEPVLVIDDPDLRHPHSVAFVPRSHHLVVTNAGANFFSIYRHDGMSLWSQTPMVQQAVARADVFLEVNLENSMEGGPKGVAVHKKRIAVCSPQIGIRIYPFRETRRPN